MRTKKCGGFTLVEVLVVIAIVAILATISFPFLSGLVASIRISARLNDLRAGIDYARSEAIRRNRVATICRAVDATSNEPRCSNRAHGSFDRRDWALGWIVFVKGAGTQTHTLEPGDEILWTESGSPGGSSARVSLVSNMPGQYFSFTGDGSRLGGALGTTFAADYRAAGATDGTSAVRCLVVSASGRARAQPGANGSCR